MTVLRHLADSAGDLGGGAPTTLTRTLSTRAAAVDAHPPTSDYSDPVIILGRIKPGRARESRRVAHVFLLGTEVAADSTLTARCGEQLPVGDMDWLPGMVGMPCEPCVLHSMAEHH
jgi:hypothetical protein